MIKVAVLGSRQHPNLEKVHEQLDQLLPRKDLIVVTGGAAGVDTLAYRWCGKHNIFCAVIVPDYHRYPGYMAPIMRNQIIAEIADEALIFWDGSSTGTKNAIESFKKRDKPVKVFKEPLK